MPINPNIALGVQPVQLENPLNAFAKAQSAQSENAMRQRQLQELDATKATETAINRAYQAAYDPMTGKIDPMKLRAAIAGAGAGSKIPAIDKGLAEADEARLKRDKMGTDLIGERMKLSRQVLDGVSTPDQFIAWHEANHADPVLGQYLSQRGIAAAQSRAKIMAALQSPGGFEQLLTESKVGAEKALERHFTEQSLGDTTRQISTPKYGDGPATVVPGSQAPINLSPYQRQQLKNEAARLQLERERVNQEKAPVITSVIDPTDPTKMVQVDARTYKGGGVGSPGAIGQSGKEPGVGITLSQKDIRSREATYPKATMALKTATTEADEMEKDLKTLATHPGLSGITGIVYGRTPGIAKEARAAQALLEKIMARGGFQELAKMRAASPTGGALGNVSNTEGEYLRQAFGALNRAQATDDFANTLNQIASRLPETREKLKEAYDLTYEYRQGNKPAAAPGGVDASNPLLK